MAADLTTTAEFEQDVADAYGWYERQRVGLGEEFLGCVDACIQRICRFPEGSPIVFDSYRRGLVRRFPYAVFYEFEESVITLYAVFHTSRDPEKWRERLS